MGENTTVAESPIGALIEGVVEETSAYEVMLLQGSSY